jgi:hypothetical protein
MVDAGYQPSNPDRHFLSVQLPSDYDVIILFDVTTASVLRSFSYPTDW